MKKIHIPKMNRRYKLMVIYIYAADIIGITGLYLPADIRKVLDIPLSIVIAILSILLAYQAYKNRLEEIKIDAEAEKSNGGDKQNITQVSDGNTMQGSHKKKILSYFETREDDIGICSKHLKIVMVIFIGLCTSIFILPFLDKAVAFKVAIQIPIFWAIVLALEFIWYMYELLKCRRESNSKHADKA